MKIILFVLASLLCIFASHGTADEPNFVEDCFPSKKNRYWNCGFEQVDSLLDNKECAVGLHPDIYLRIEDEEIKLGAVPMRDDVGDWVDLLVMKKSKPRLPRETPTFPTIFYQGKLINKEGYMTVILEQMADGNACQDSFGMAIQSNTKVFVLSGTNLWHGCCRR